MKATITESQRDIPIRGRFDLVVAGGGIAGVAAAVTGAREGLSVCLIEKQLAFGGLATLGNVAIYLPLCDGHGRQVIGGIAEELLRLSVSDRPQELPDSWRSTAKRYQVTFNPASFMLALDDFVVDSGVTILFDARVCAAVRDGRRIAAVIAEGKAGRFAIEGRSFIDATGDADLAFAAGAAVVTRASNVAAGWFYIHGPDGSIRLKQLTRPYDRYGRAEKEEPPLYSGTSPEDLTAFSLESRRRISESLADTPGATPYQLPAVASVRMTRRIAGRRTVTEADVDDPPADTVAGFGSWREPGPEYPLPLSVLQTEELDNLFAAGRCIAADGLVWDLARAIPVCALSGEVAAIAAAHTTDPEQIRRRLRERGGIPYAPNPNRGA